jgi:hydrogenase maturation factor
VSSCGDDHCITCSDEGVEMHVLEPGRDGLSVCAADGGTVRTEVMTDLVGDLAQGDRVLVHAGVAIARLT